MYGQTVPRLTVGVLIESTNETNEMWTLHGSQADEWRRATLPISFDERFSVLVYALATSVEIRLAKQFNNFYYLAFIGKSNFSKKQNLSYIKQSFLITKNYHFNN